MLLAFAPVAACQPGDPYKVNEKSIAGMDQQKLAIHSAGNRHEFVVEIARSEQEQATGLMHRQSLAPDRGMIFPYEVPKPASFWMRNTYIPLDLVFIAPGGTVQKVEANAVPLSEESLVSDGPVEAVLELAGGRAAEIGLSPGDRVDWKR